MWMLSLFIFCEQEDARLKKNHSSDGCIHMLFVFFDITVIVYPPNISAHYRNDCPTPFGKLLGI